MSINQADAVSNGVESNSRQSDADVLARLTVQRFSCRAFRPDPVPDKIISRILEIAQHTASWCNLQPWQVILTRGAGTERFRAAMYDYASKRRPQPDFPHPREYQGVYRERRRECGLQLYASIGISREASEAAAAQAMENFNLFGAPHVAIITCDEALGVYGAIDCGGYLSNFLLAAQSHGVATVPQAALAAYPCFIREHFQLEKEQRVVVGVSFGYADQEHPINCYRTSRAPIMQNVTWIDS